VTALRSADNVSYYFIAKSGTVRVPALAAMVGQGSGNHREGIVVGA